MYHIFFIHSSVSGHLGCFHVLAIVNSAAMNVGVHGSFLIMVFSGYMPRSGIVYLLWINIQVLCTFLNSSFYYKKYSLTLLLQLTIDILFFFFNLFIYGCVGSSFLCEDFLQLRQVGATLHRGARASHHRGLSCCGAQAPDAQAQQLWLTGLVAPRHVGSSQPRARTRVPCIGRQILNHCAIRESSIDQF